MNSDREAVLSPEQYAQLEAELRKFEQREGAFKREYIGQWVDAPQPTLVRSVDWATKPVERLDAAALVERYPAPNRKQRRAMLSVARRAR